MALAGRVMDGLADCGFKTDPKGAIASKPLFARSHAAWLAAVNSWIDNPTQEKALILVSLVVDGRPVWGIRTGPPVPDAFRDARRNPRCCTCSRSSRCRTARRPASCAASWSRTRASTAAGSTSSAAASSRSPTSPAGRALAAGVTHASTPARLRAAADAGTLRGRRRAAARGGARADRRAAARRTRSSSSRRAPSPTTSSTPAS